MRGLQALLLQGFIFGALGALAAEGPIYNPTTSNPNLWNQSRIEDIFRRQEHTSEDLVYLSNFIDESDVDSSIVGPVRQLFVGICIQNPELFEGFIPLAKAKLYPTFVSNLILLALGRSSRMIEILRDHQYIDQQAIRELLKRSQGYSPYLIRKLGQTAEINDAIKRNLVVQMPGKLEIAFELFDLGIRDYQITDLLIEALQSTTLLTRTKIQAIIRLGRSGAVDRRIVLALKEIALSPQIDSGATRAEDLSLKASRRGGHWPDSHTGQRGRLMGHFRSATR